MSDEPLLRPWRVQDAPTLLRHRRSSPDLENNLPELRDVAQARETIERWTQEWCFAMVLNGVAIGNVSVTALDRRHSIGWFSYWMAPAGRGKRWTSRAAATVADWALFDAPDPLFRVELGHRTNNPASGRIALAAGFVQEGHERQKLSYHGVRYDTLTYSRLQTDPRPQVRPLEMQLD
ncbi:GNAT family protein [Luteococcus peritonei]|uniref:GNAT family protein n=1 Tax=Luteococcus peritonei TaxID=88874 RepID=A0ABW4RSZ0_9ACTN